MKHINLKSPAPHKSEKKYKEFEYQIISRIFLSDPFIENDKPFTTVLKTRKSRRTFDFLLLEKLNSLLWLSARTIRLLPFEDGVRQLQHRPSPSAGGRHPIDIFIIRLNEISPKIFLYQNIPHALAELNVRTERLLRLLAEAEIVLPHQQATVLWFGAQFDRTMSKYKNGESLIWKDTGVLMATIAFVAEFLDLNCCPLGITGEPYLSNLFDSSQVLGVGGMYIGSRKS